MTHDRVRVSVEREGRGERYRGEILKVISRGHRKVVGQFQPNRDGGGLIRDEGKGWGSDLQIQSSNTMNAQPGELVAAEIITYPDEGAFTGKVVEVLGDIADPLTDIKRVLITQHIPHVWPPEIAKEAKQFSHEVSEKDIKGRVDLRKLHFVTIDGATAKDFDDAIYIEEHGNHYKLYVAIADVSHYVRIGSAIDQEAYERGTSVYFPNFVEPMLPEVLSNGLCSLNPKVPRLALVAEMDFDMTGHKTASKFYEAVIESKARVTYGEAQELIEGGHSEKFKHVREDILRAADLAKILMAKRFADGSMELEIPETQLVIDAAGNPIDIIKSDRLFAHRVIEEMMLAANVAVAEFLSSRNIPSLYRVHEPPPPDAIATLEKFLRTFGGRTKLSGDHLQKKLNRALQEFTGKPQAQVLNILALRSMSQAKYSHNNVGHFGLGFENYSHFTSPIRRYPDLIVHRLLKNQIGLRQYKLMTEDDIATAGQMLSACEQRSTRAERQIQAIKKARYMEPHIGEEFDGMISSVTKFGVFVSLRKFEIDGLVPLEVLSGGRADQFIFDEERLRLVGKRSGQAFNLGDTIRVRVTKADPELGQVDFELASSQKKSTGRMEDRPEAFDVDKKLRDILNRRGLKPTEALDNPRSVRRLGFGSEKESHHGRNDKHRDRDRDHERGEKKGEWQGEERRKGNDRRQDSGDRRQASSSGGRHDQNHRGGKPGGRGGGSGGKRRGGRGRPGKRR